MVRTSTTAASEEEFLVAVAAGDCGWKHRDIPASEPGSERGNVAAHRLVDRGVADDALPDRAARRFELRLDQGKHVTWGGGKLEGHGKHELQRNEADIDRDDV